METVWKLEARWLVRGILAATIAAFSAAAGAQSGGQSNGSSPPQSSAPTSGRSAVAPPPADLEPGVNTSATQMSSPEPVPAPQKSTPTLAKPARAAGTAAGAASAAATSAPPSAPNATASAPAANGPAGAPAGGAATARAGTVPKSGAPGASGAAGKAHDSLQLDTTQITGNRELPKVLYIVPWKRSDLGDLVGKPVNSLLDEVLTPVDRDVFKRQNRYYEALKPDAAKDAAGAAVGADVKH
jgi:hypothetical protein